MNITQREEDDITVFMLEGRVDSEGAAELEQTLLNAVATAKHKMILDMSEVRYINSAGLRILADVLTVNRENGGDLRLVALNPKVRRVFEIIGFHKFFPDYDTLLAAMAGY